MRKKQRSLMVVGSKHRRRIVSADQVTARGYCVYPTAPPDDRKFLRPVETHPNAHAWQRKLAFFNMLRKRIAEGHAL